MNFNDNLMHILYNFNPNCIYFAIGSALPYQNKISRDEHQQYPSFLDKFDEMGLTRKLFIFIDPRMEFPLKIQEDIAFIDELIEFNEDHTKLENDNTVVLSKNDNFYFPTNPHARSSDKFLMETLLNYAAENNVYLIIEPFDGSDDRYHFYDYVMPMPNAEKILHYVKYNISDQDHSCMANFKDVKLPLVDGRFIHCLNADLTTVAHVSKQLMDKIIEEKYNKLYYVLNFYKTLTQGKKYDYLEGYMPYIKLFINITLKINVDMNDPNIVRIVRDTIMTFASQLINVKKVDPAIIGQFDAYIDEDSSSNFFKLLNDVKKSENK